MSHMLLFAGKAMAAALVAAPVLMSQPGAADAAARSSPSRNPAPIRWVDDRVVQLPPRVAHKTFLSPSMKHDVGYLIYLPPGYEQGEKRYPVLYWLHGLGGTEYRFPELAVRVDKAIAEKKIPPMMVAFPNAGAWGFYSDSPDGKVLAETLVIKEFIPHIDQTYRTIAAREGRMLQGYSMGGHGALKLALKYPELFSSVAAGAPAMLDAESLSKSHGYILERMFNNDAKLYTANRPLEIARAKADEIRGKLPMMIFVGSVDGLLKYSEEFRDLLAQKNIPLEFVMCEGKSHDKNGCYDLAFDRLMEFQLRYLGVEAGGKAADRSTAMVVIRPAEYPHALKNPLKGFRAGQSHPFATLRHAYIPWNLLEEREQDGVDKIRGYCDRIWKDLPQHNVKAIPRVWLTYPGKPSGWPSDLQKDDYLSPQFQARVVSMVKKLGQCWDSDPRIAYVEMGIVGKWGEQHTPYVSTEMQETLGNAFSLAFTNQLVMVRHPGDFRGYHFGIYWDSWAHQDEMNWAKGGGSGIAALGDRWKTAVMGGETAYNWGNHKIQPGDNPTDTLTDPAHLEFLLDTIRQLHCNHLGWVADYDRNNPAAKVGAERVQKALGYRFVIDEVRYPAMVSANKPFKVLFTVRNTGSSPFYYNWPVELSLLHPRTREVVWRDTFKDLDIRRWLPGDKWNRELRSYDVAPPLFEVEGTFALPESVSMDKYILSLAILDPAGMLPAVRFAVRSYFQGGRHPIGVIGIGKAPRPATLDPASFDNPGDDTTLHYLATINLGR